MVIIGCFSRRPLHTELLRKFFHAPLRHAFGLFQALVSLSNISSQWALNVKEKCPSM